ncbi:Hint domain-containing protein [Paracoccus tegillarcae]|uniref:Type I secretion protein n=1 Tax=Paracoccus tegillarcae TaxID=1529068 RepID=A0A2K9ERF2_9RHOB|nr:Hint domain-containing protein [Paracoccus tegillarcae]AUH33356.1 type I secretion protein [Paracoccus tegillarcae]
MPVVYVYSPSDFVQGLPDEQGSAAAGSPNFRLTLRPGATPTAIEISDDDAVFDEVDENQTVTSTVTIDGRTIPAGTTVHTAYDLLNPSSGHKVTSLMFGGDGFQQGAVDGLVSTVELVPGRTYVFNQERTSHQQANGYAGYFACFAAGTRIETDRGQVAVEDLREGDMIATLDAGFQPLRLKLSRKVTSPELRETPKLRPVRIKAGALGGMLPARDLLVSRQHRMLAVSPIARRMFGVSEVLISAIKLTDLPGIYVDTAVEEVDYYHLILDDHLVIFAEGAPTESFYRGDNALQTLSPAAMQELATLFPDMVQRDGVRLIPEGKRQRMFVRRHLENDKELVAGGPRLSSTGP